MAEQNQNQKQTWNPELYDGKLGIVSEWGAGVMDWLAPTAGERVLDLGCGTGDLAAQLTERGAVVIGIDASPEMIRQAAAKYPAIRFEVADAQTHRHQGVPFDAVFSNAALHWMPDAAGVAQGVWHALRPGGRFAAELGGRGNVAAIVAAVQAALQRRYGIQPGPEAGPWYFPSMGEYASLLERVGFRVERAIHFDRPTPMQDGEEGLRHWLNSFGEQLLAPVPEVDREAVYTEVRDALKDRLFREGVWQMDYVRLRVLAVKC